MPAMAPLDRAPVVDEDRVPPMPVDDDDPGGSDGGGRTVEEEEGGAVAAEMVAVDDAKTEGEPPLLELRAVVDEPSPMAVEDEDAVALVTLAGATVEVDDVVEEVGTELELVGELSVDVVVDEDAAVVVDVDSGEVDVSMEVAVEGESEAVVVEDEVEGVREGEEEGDDTADGTCPRPPANPPPLIAAPLLPLLAVLVGPL